MSLSLEPTAPELNIEPPSAALKEPASNEPIVPPAKELTKALNAPESSRV
jgi:hypothetical protein